MKNMKWLLALLACFGLAFTYVVINSGSQMQKFDVKNRPRLQSLDTNGLASNVSIIVYRVLGPVRDSDNWSQFVADTETRIRTGTLSSAEPTTPTVGKYIATGRVDSFNLMYALPGGDRLWKDIPNPTGVFASEYGQIPWDFVWVTGMNGKVAVSEFYSECSSPNDPGLSETFSPSGTYAQLGVSAMLNGQQTSSGSSDDHADNFIIPVAPRLYDGGNSATGRSEINQWVVTTQHDHFSIEMTFQMKIGDNVLKSVQSIFATYDQEQFPPISVLISHEGTNSVRVLATGGNPAASYQIQASSTSSGPYQAFDTLNSGSSGVYPTSQAGNFFRAVQQ